MPRSRLADNSFRGVSLRIDCGLGRAREVGEKADSMERTRTVLQEERTAHSLVASTWRSRNSASVSGQVLDVRGDIVPEAKLEIWQTDHLGHYDLDGYRYRATLISDAGGKYSFDSVMPGDYPDRVCQHIHYLVTAPGHKTITTQLYFATDPVFEGDPGRNFSREPLLASAELVRPVVLRGDPKNVFADVNFELVMERL